MSTHLDPADIAGLASLEPGAPDRRAADEHAAACPPCRAALADAARTLALLDDLAAPPRGAEAERALSRAHAAVLAEWEAPAPSPATARAPLVMGLAAVGAWLLALVTARHHDGSRAAWSVVGVAVAAAGALLVTARQRLALVVLGAASLVLALGVAGEGPLLPLVGAVCLAYEQVAAAVTLGALLRLRRAAAAPSTSTLVAAATAGAVAGQAALHVTCRSTSTPHLLVFHVGGVLLAALLTLAAAPRLRRAA